MRSTGYFVFYDGLCRFCRESVETLRRMEPSADVVFINVRDRGLLDRFPMVDPEAALGQMHVVDPAGKLTGGYDAIVALLPTLPSLRAFAPLLGWQLLRPLGRAAYRWVARNRFRLAGVVPTCQGGVCKLPV